MDLFDQSDYIKLQSELLTRSWVDIIKSQPGQRHWIIDDKVIVGGGILCCRKGKDGRPEFLLALNYECDFDKDGMMVKLSNNKPSMNFYWTFPGGTRRRGRDLAPTDMALRKFNEDLFFYPSKSNPKLYNYVRDILQRKADIDYLVLDHSMDNSVSRVTYMVDITGHEINLEDFTKCEDRYCLRDLKYSPAQHTEYWGNYPDRSLAETFGVGWKKSDVWAKPKMYKVCLGNVTNHVDKIEKFFKRRDYTWDDKEKHFYEIAKKNMQ